MKMIYEVRVNGATVYNGDDGKKARTIRDEWKRGKGGHKVEYTTVPVPSDDEQGLTENELAVLKAIDASEYGDCITDAIWTWSVADHCKTLKGKAISGTISSLEKKGLTKSQDTGRDANIAMTIEGAHVYAAAVGKDRRKWIDDADFQAMQAANAATRIAAFAAPAPETKPDSSAIAGFIREHAEELARLIPSATFALESVAHLQGKEALLLPMTDRLREILSGKAVRS